MLKEKNCRARNQYLEKKDSPKPRKLWTNIPYEHRHKNPSPNIRKKIYQELCTMTMWDLLQGCKAAAVLEIQSM